MKSNAWILGFTPIMGLLILFGYQNCGGPFERATESLPSQTSGVDVPSPNNPDPEPQPPPQSDPEPDTVHNGIWVEYSGGLLTTLSEANLKALASRGIFHIYVKIGYPSPADDPELAGIVPACMTGILIKKDEVTELKKRFAQVDPRLRLWGWAGTWCTPPSGTTNVDAAGHQLAKVDATTAFNRSVIIRNLVKVASWGFYGIQDDTEDWTDNSLVNGQAGDAQVAFWNEEARALHAIGVKLVPFTPAVWYNFNSKYVSQITEPDFHILVPSNSDPEQQWLDLTRLFLKNSKIPVVIDIGGKSTCPEITKRIDEKLPLSAYPQVIGYALYAYRGWSSDWSCWDSWHK